MTSSPDSFLDVFSKLEDPRIDRRKLHPLPEILLLTLCGVIAGCDGWEDIEDYGKLKLDFLRSYLPYENGIPSDDTLRRLFRVLDPQEFQERFVTWVQGFTEFKQQIIAIDGKTSRRSFDTDKKALHLVTAFATEARLVLAQMAVEEKTNEITAIPDLLDWLDCKDSLVTIDAMGCQKAIATKIRSKGGDYLLALKGNHAEMHSQVEEFFADIELKQSCEHCKMVDGEHGRIEIRECFVCNDIEWLYGKREWQGLKSIVSIESSRECKGQVQKERRLYISSIDSNAERLLLATRSHWGIENQVHWVLDMSFNEDQIRIRKGNAPQNMAVVRHISLNMIQSHKKPRQSIKRLRKMAGWDNDTLEQILCAMNKF